MFPAPRRRGATRLAAGSVLAATALASGGFAALGATAAHADGTTGTYTNPTATSWATDGSGDATVTSVYVPDSMSSLASVSLTLHNFTDDDVSGLNLYLFDPNTNSNPVMLESDPSTMAGGPAVNGQDITFSSDGTGEQGNGDSLAQEIGQPGTGEWDLVIWDDHAHLVGSFDSWTLDLTSTPNVTTQPDDVSALSGDSGSIPGGSSWCKSHVPNPTPPRNRRSTDSGSGIHVASPLETSTRK